MRVSIVVTDTRRGGAPTRLADLALGLRACGHTVQVVSVMPAGEIAAELELCGFSVADLAIRAPWHAPRGVWRLHRELRRFGPDVVQSALFHANLLSRVVGSLLRVPVVSGYESVDDELPRWRALVDRWTAPLARRHIAVSRAVAERVSARSRIPRSMIDVVPIGRVPPKRADRASVRARWGIPADAVVVGFVGRLHPVKNLSILGEAVDLLPGEPWLLVVGDGSERQALDGRRRTVVTGMLADPSPLYSAMDVFVLPSRWEGMPVALIEAMGAGLPVVATSVGGVTEVVTDGVDGLLVPASDARALAQATAIALERPELGARATDTVRTRFTPLAYLNAHLRIYEKLVRDSRA